MSVKELVKFLADIELTEQEHYIGDQILKEIRCEGSCFLQHGWVWTTSPLPAGRAKSFRAGSPANTGLATQIRASGLVGVAYILDEPKHRTHNRVTTTSCLVHL